MILVAAAIAASLSLAELPQDAPSRLSLYDGPTVGEEPSPEDAVPAARLAKPEDVWDKNAFSYLAPVAEIVAFEVLLNLFDRNVTDPVAYGVTADSIRANLHHPWVLDVDSFSMNMFEHPYSGALFYGFARSAGHGMEVSFLYAAFGSVVWEYAGETGPASLNDVIMTSVGGSFLGEALFRMGNLLLRAGGSDPGVLRQVIAGVLLPTATVDVYGNRALRSFDDHDPAIFLRMSLGAGRIMTESHTPDADSNVGKWNGLADVTLKYGLPGEPGYTYDRPFDYFTFQFTGSNTAQAGLGNVMIQGLLYGAPYKAGSDYRGIWGLYGNYDYISEETFRVATSALSLGTTGQCWLSRVVALQGTVTAGCGFGAGGNFAPVLNRDYVYGVMPQGLVNLRAIFGNVVALETTGREYFIRGTGTDNRYALENTAHLEATVSVRIIGPLAIGVRYSRSEQDSRFTTLGTSSQSRGILGFTISFLGDSGFGAVNWDGTAAPSEPASTTP